MDSDREPVEDFVENANLTVVEVLAENDPALLFRRI